MNLKIQCPNPECKKGYSVSDSQLGRNVVCKACGSRFALSGSSISPAAASADTGEPGAANTMHGASVPEKLGRFEVRTRIGGGAFGVVYRGYDPTLNREVALKVPHRGTSLSEKRKSRVLVEAKAAAQLRHPNIVPVYEAGQDGDTFYIASAFIDGQTLEDAMDKGQFQDSSLVMRRSETFHSSFWRGVQQLWHKKRLSNKSRVRHARAQRETVAGNSLTSHAANAPHVDFCRVAKVIMDLARALDYSHHLGVVHRDVKPANIMLDRTGAPLVTDFGLARLDEMTSQNVESEAGAAVKPQSLPVPSGELANAKLTQDGTVLGTPVYMAPEQAKGQQALIGPASDQYSLGAVLYEMCCGQQPFSGPPGMVLSLVRSGEEPVSSRRVNPEIPVDLEAICRKAMSKAPRDRYDSCGAMADDLRRWLDGEVIHARRLNVTQRAMHWCRRNPLVAGSAASVAIVMVLATVVSSLFGMAAKREARLADEANQTAQKQRDIAEGQRKRADRERDRAEEQKNSAEHNLYVASLGLAHVNWLAAEMGETIRLLDLAPKQFRDWEWWYLNRLCTSAFPTVDGLRTVTFSPNGKCIASAAYDDSVKVWDAETGTVLLTLCKHTAKVQGVSFSPDGSRLASASSDKTLIVWNARDGEVTQVFRRHEQPVKSVAFSPDGRLIASVSDTAVMIWETDSGDVKHRIEPTETCSLFHRARFSRDGRQLAIEGVAGSVEVRDLALGCTSFCLEGDIVREQVGPLFTSNQQVLTSLDFSPDGKWIATSDSGNEVKVWDAATGKKSFSLQGHEDGVQDVTFSPDGSQIASASADHTVRLWDFESKKNRLTLRGHLGGVFDVEFSPDGTRLATASDDKTARVWALDREQECLTLAGNMGAIVDLAFSPDGKRFVSVSLSPLTLLTGVPDGIPWKPGLEADKLNKVAIVRDAANGAERGTLGGHQWSALGVAFSPNGDMIATCSDDKTAKVWDAGTYREMYTLRGHTAAVTDVAFSSEGDRIFTVSRDKTLRVWRAFNGQEIQSLRKSLRGSSAVERNLLLTWTMENHRVEVCDLVSLQNVCTLNAAEKICCVAISADKRQVAATTGNVIKVWHMGEGEPHLILAGHGAEVKSVEFSPNGRRLVTGSRDRTAKVWDLSTGHEVITLRHDKPVGYVAFTPDGKSIITGAGFGTVRIWDSCVAIRGKV